jgi:hypothetical protein
MLFGTCPRVTTQRTGPEAGGRVKQSQRAPQWHSRGGFPACDVGSCPAPPPRVRVATLRRHPSVCVGGGLRLDNTQQAQHQEDDHKGNDQTHNAVRTTHSLHPSSRTIGSAPRPCWCVPTLPWRRPAQEARCAVLGNGRTSKATSAISTSAAPPTPESRIFNRFLAWPTRSACGAPTGWGDRPAIRLRRVPGPESSAQRDGLPPPH